MHACVFNIEHTDLSNSQSTPWRREPYKVNWAKCYQKVERYCKCFVNLLQKETWSVPKTLILKKVLLKITNHNRTTTDQEGYWVQDGFSIMCVRVGCWLWGALLGTFVHCWYLNIKTNDQIYILFYFKWYWSFNIKNIKVQKCDILKIIQP